MRMEQKHNTFGGIARMLASGLVSELHNGIDQLKSIIHPTGYRNIAAFLKRDAQTQDAIIQVLNKYLGPWHNPFNRLCNIKIRF